MTEMGHPVKSACIPKSWTSIPFSFCLVAVAVLLLPAAVCSQTRIFSLSSPLTGADFGISVAGLGDLDGDGFEDFVVGAPESYGRRGSAQVFSGKDVKQIYEFKGVSGSSGFGYSVARAGDVNKDGIPDILVGAHGMGRVHVYSGADGNLIRRIDTTKTQTKFGWSVAGAGDVNKDGYDDVLIGAPDEGQDKEGAAHLCSGLNGTTLMVFKGQNAGDHLGWSVSGLGDINGDAVPDFILGEPFSDDPATDAGRILAISGLTLTTLHLFKGTQYEEYFGYSVSSAGDADRDGVKDLVVGAPGYEGNRGLARVISGKGDTIRDFIGASSISRLGYAVASAGDVDGDGYSDVVLGSPNDLKNGKVVGTIQVYTVKGKGRRLWISHGDETSFMGYSASGGGDSNRDGIPDIVAGLPWGTTRISKVVLFSGADVARVGVASRGNATITSTPWAAGQPFVISGADAPAGKAGFLAVSLAPMLPTELVPDFVIYIDPAAMILFTPVLADGSGKWSFPLAVPNDPALIGLDFASQAAFPANNPLLYQLTPGYYTHVTGPEDLDPPAVQVNLQPPIVTNKKILDVPITVTDAASTFTTVLVNGKRGDASGLKTFVARVPLDEGSNQLEIISTDEANNLADPVVVTGITLDSTPPELFNMVPAPKEKIHTKTFTVSGESNEELVGVTLNSKPVQLLPGNKSFSGTFQVTYSGPLTLTWVAEDRVGNKRTLPIPVIVVGGPIITSLPIRSAAVEADYKYDVVAVHPRPGEKLTFSLPVAPAGAKIDARTGLIEWRPAKSQAGKQAVTVRVTDTSLNFDEQPFEVDVKAPPPDPKTVAPPLSKTASSAISEATEFLYAGPVPIQTGVKQNAVEMRRAGVMMGLVILEDGTPLPGVTVTVVDHPEFGQTLSRADGMYDMAVNGGGYLSFRFERNGFIPLQRQMKIPWLDQGTLPPVTMIPYDTKVTEVDFSSTAGIQVAAGSEVTDKDGTRKAALFFKPGTQATMFVGEDALPLSRINVRASEYTVGENGETKMPAPLPPESAYTYAVELTADEVLATDADALVFSSPVPLYVENFLDFPVGEVVPTGYFDRRKKAWVPSQNGRIIKILSITGGLAEVDIDGSNRPASKEALAKLGIDDEERKKLAVMYKTGQSLMRSPIPHFSPWDMNWPWGPPPDAVAPGLEEADEGDRLNPDDPDLSCGSIIQNENQVLGEQIPVVGTPFMLSYATSRVFSFAASRELVIPITGKSVPASLEEVILIIEIAGRKFEKAFSPTANQSYIFRWDGMDGYGRVVQGSRDANIQIGFKYAAVYNRPAAGRLAFLTNSGVPITGSRARRDIILWQKYTRTLKHWDHRSAGLGGWCLDVHHSYDPGSVLHLGNGGRRNKSWGISKVVTTFAGTGTAECAGNGPASETRLGYVAAVAAGPDGSLYIAEDGCHRIRRVDSDGMITTFAGQGVRGFGGDHGPAAAALLKNPSGIAVGPDGTIIVADTFNHRIRSVSPGGVIETVAGNGIGGHGGDGGPAVEASLQFPHGVAVTPDGSILIADSANYRIRRINPDGIIDTIAGDGTRGYRGDGGPALSSAIGLVYHIAVGPDGSIYFSDEARIRKIGINGIINTIAGNGTKGFSGDGGPATQARIDPRGLTVDTDDTVIFAEGTHRVRGVDAEGVINTLAGNGEKKYSGDGGAATAGSFVDPVDVAVGPEGRIYVADYQNFRVRMVAHPLPGFTRDEIAIASGDGSRLFKFDKNGRHLETIGLLTGEKIYTFRYTPGGLLSEVEDVAGNITRILRDTKGAPTAIVAPHGQVTKLALDASEFLESVENPAGEKYGFTYVNDGLLFTLKDPEQNGYTFTYDTTGRLTRDDDPAAGFQTFSRTESNQGYEVTRTSALSRKTRYLVEQQDRDTVRRVVMNPDGTSVTIVSGSDATRTTTMPGGTVVTMKRGPDPRFGMDAPLNEKMEIAFPSKLKYVSTTSRSVTLANRNDPLSLVSMTTTVDVNGREFKGMFDRMSKTITDTTPEGRTVTRTLDDRGRVVLQKMPKVEALGLAYNGQGKVTTLRIGSGAGARETVFFHDSLGRVSTIKDALGRRRAFTYDMGGRIASRTLPGGQKILYRYDLNGNRTSISPPGRPAHGFTYTPLGQVKEYRPPSVGTWAPETKFRYDLDRRLEEILRPDGKKATFMYDAAGRLSRKFLPIGTVTYGYDPVSGRVRTITNPAATLTFTYDGSLHTRTQYSGAVRGTFTRTHDSDLAVSSSSVNGTYAIAFQYDRDKILTGAGSMTLAHDAGNGMLSSTRIGSVSDSYTYTSFGELSGYSASYNSINGYSATYTRDTLGRIASLSETVLGTTTSTTYAYDVNGRLATVTRGATTVQYGYDGNGNRIRYSTGGSPVTATHDDQDRLLTYGSLKFEYTRGGELMKMTDGSKITLYDYCILGNLMKVTLPDARVIEYLIDGRGRRVGKKVNGTLIKGFLYKDLLNPVAELNSSGGVVSRFVYASRQHVPDYMIKGGATYRIITDHLGSPRLVIDVATGTVEQEMEYDEFGVVLKDSNPGFQPFGYAGGLYDPDTGLVRFGTRDYFARIGRWTTKDPILFDGMDANLYGYVANDPVNRIDPTGLRLTYYHIGGTIGLGKGISIDLGLVHDDVSGNWAYRICASAGASIGGGVMFAKDYESGSLVKGRTTYSSSARVEAAVAFIVGGGESVGLSLTSTNCPDDRTKLDVDVSVGTRWGLGASLGVFVGGCNTYTF